MGDKSKKNKGAGQPYCFNIRVKISRNFTKEENDLQNQSIILRL